MRYFRFKSLGRRSAVAAVAALTLGGISLAAAPAKSAWLSTFTVSTIGGHVVGNPAAATKLVEYASYTCGHCADFEAADVPVLKSQYVAGGKTSFEVRNLVRDPLDLTASLLARCGGKGRFFGNHRQLMATQGQWANGEKISKATEAKLNVDDLTGFMQGAYSELGLNKIMAARGVTAAQAKLCLTDATALKTVIAMSEEAGKLGINGTPAFTINGKVVDGHDIADLKAKLPK